MRFDLAFLGFGNVARAFVRQIATFRDRLSAEGISPRIVAIATRRHGVFINPDGVDPSALDAAGLPPPAFPSGAAYIADVAAAMQPSASEGRLVLIETTVLDIQHGRPAIDHVRAALEHGLHVITANKGPAAFAYGELEALARRSGRLFRFEGAVMDGIPVFNLVRETLPCAEVVGFRGIVNSTTNFMLTGMERGRSFEDALADMQRQGIAEADPTLDVDGWDAAAKTAALANVLLGAAMTPHDVDREGIRGVTTARVRDALDAGGRLRLVASAAREGGGVSARVRLERLAADDLLARLDGMQNALVVRTDVLGDVAIAELTAGLEQTAYGLLTDLVSVARFVTARRPAPPAARRDRTR